MIAGTEAGRTPASAASVVIRAGLIGAAYFLAAKLGLRLAFSNQNVTSVWPPTGIAVAGLLLFGPRMWPGIAAGALIANLTNLPLPTALGIAVGNTLAPMVGATLLRRLDIRPSLDRVRDVIALVFVGGLASMLISATGGTTALAATGHLAPASYGSTWFVWWTGDALGVVLFAPLILTFFSPESDLSLFGARVLESAVLFAGAAAATLLVFRTHVPMAHLLFPFMIWAALRFYSQGAAAMTVVVSGIAILQTATHHGPFALFSRTTDLESLQAFNATLALVGLALAAVTLERRAAQVSLAFERETARRLKTLDEFKDSLLMAVSHELRTPLTVIIGLASTLRNPNLDLAPDDLEDLLIRLEANAQRLDRLLMDLLDIDRLNRRVVEPNPRETLLHGTVLRVLDALQIEGHPVSVEVGEASVAVDPAHLERIIENLVANAVKHTPPRTRIWVRADRNKEWVTLYVDDEGAGVPSDIREAIFEPFRRGNLRSHAPGTGVGLSLVARFATLNGGRAWVEERDGGGASFRVRLPSAPTKAPVP